jgi:hypothetical protein
VTRRSYPDILARARSPTSRSAATRATYTTAATIASRRTDDQPEKKGPDSWLGAVI